MYRALIAEIARLTPTQKKALLAGYRALFTGKPVSVAALTGVPYVVAEHGEVLAVFGLDRRPCPHQLWLGDVRRDTWCVWDGFFIAEALGVDARVESRDPLSGENLVAFWQDGVWQVESAWWVSFPRACATDTGLRGSFCRFVHVFACRDHALCFQAQHGCAVEPISVLLARSRAMAQAICICDGTTEVAAS